MRIFAPIGLLGLIPLVYMVSGDPLLWLVERLRPGTVPMDDFKPINGKTILIVFNTEVVEFAQNARDEVVATATLIGRDTFAKFRKQASAGADTYRRGEALPPNQHRMVGPTSKFTKPPKPNSSGLPPPAAMWKQSVNS